MARRKAYIGLLLSLFIGGAGASTEVLWRQYHDHESAYAVITKQSEAIKVNPDQANPYILRGNAYFELRDFESAITDFSKAISINNKADLAYFGRGMALGRLGAIDDAIKDLSVYIERNPDSSVAHTKRGIRHLWNNDMASAERDLRKAIELDPNNAEANDDLGVILAQRGDYDTAAKHFAKTVSIDPTYQKGYHNLAMVYYITNHNNAALASVNTALELQPGNKNSMMLKGNILKELGMDKDAAEVLEAAEFLPDGGWSEQAPVK